MRYLFVHQNGPGQYLHVVRHLARNPAHQIVFITEAHDRPIPGVQHIVYRLERDRRADLHPQLRELELATHRAEIVARLARNLRALGFQPDIIVGPSRLGRNAASGRYLAAGEDARLFRILLQHARV